jgi:hypothetical protein
MDKFWSVLSMPIGLFLCFTPVLIAWVIEGSKQPEQRDTQQRR